jgi:hypothetical protein
MQAWEMQCCGHPFQIGDTVDWIVQDNHSLNISFDDLFLPHIDFVCQHHSPDSIRLKLQGVVEKILGIYVLSKPSAANPGILRTVSWLTSPFAKVEHYEYVIDAYRISCYLAELKDVIIGSTIDPLKYE